MFLSPPETRLSVTLRVKVTGQLSERARGCGGGAIKVSTTSLGGLGESRDCERANVRSLLLPGVYQGASVVGVCMTCAAIERDSVTFPDGSRQYRKGGSWRCMRRGIDRYCQRFASGRR